MPLPLQRVVVVGAGPAGLATALCLSKLGLQVTVLDENPAPAWTGVAVLDDVALRLLDLLDLGAQVRAQGVALGRAVLQQSDGARGQERPVQATVIPTEALCQRLQAGLAPVQRGRRVVQVQDRGADVLLSLADGAVETCDLVVLACGAASPLRPPVEPGASLDVFHLTLASTAVKLGPGEALEVIGPSCGLWLIPAPGGIAGRLYAPASKGAPDAEALPAAARLLGAAASWLAAPTSVTRRTVTRGAARPLWAGRVVAVGDAAHEVAPTQLPEAPLGLEDAKALQLALDRSASLDEARLLFERLRRDRVLAALDMTWELLARGQESSWKGLFRQAMRSLSGVVGPSVQQQAGEVAVETLLSYQPGGSSPAGTSRALLRFLVKIGQVDGLFDDAERDFVRSSLFELGACVEAAELVEVEQQTRSLRVIDIVQPFVDLDLATRERVVHLGVLLSAASGSVASAERKALVDTVRALDVPRETYDRMMAQVIGG